MRVFMVVLLVLVLGMGVAQAGGKFWPDPEDFSVNCGDYPWQDYETIEVWFECAEGETLWSIGWLVRWDGPNELDVGDFQAGDFWGVKTQYFYSDFCPGEEYCVWAQQWPLQIGHRGSTGPRILATFKVACAYNLAANPPACYYRGSSEFEFDVMWAYNRDMEDISADVSYGTAGGCEE